MVGGHEHSHAGAGSRPRRPVWLAGLADRPLPMKARVFEVILHKLPSGKSPASALESQLNDFLEQFPGLQVVATHMNTIVTPAEPNAMPSSSESSIIIFCTLFYNNMGS
jgi:hypothetical protein